MSWGYTVENGPTLWHVSYPQASGERQSPIDIKTSLTKQYGQANVSPLSWKYSPSNCKSLVNTGHCWRVDVNKDDSSLTGGPLGKDIYKLEQFHCHWGCSDAVGSEHTVNGTSFAGELHLVHWNSTKYKSFADATKAPDGLAVLGIFLKGGSHHAELGKVTSLLPYITHKGDRVTIPKGCDPSKFLPNSLDYWTYEGSLTTPPCSECVIWIVFQTPIEVSHEQLDAMRCLYCFDYKEECHWEEESNGKLLNNYRPPLPLGKRELREMGH